ncbi:MAG: hypothetical protein QXR87_03260 [Candidatus Hadarchaeales archaeon]
MRARRALAAITLPLLAYFLTVLSLGLFWSSVEDLSLSIFASATSGILAAACIGKVAFSRGWVGDRKKFLSGFGVAAAVVLAVLWAPCIYFILRPEAFPKWVSTVLFVLAPVAAVGAGHRFSGKGAVMGGVSLLLAFSMTLLPVVIATESEVWFMIQGYFYYLGDPGKSLENSNPMENVMISFMLPSIVDKPPDTPQKVSSDWFLLYIDNHGIENLDNLEEVEAKIFMAPVSLVYQERPTGFLLGLTNPSGTRPAVLPRNSPPVILKRWMDVEYAESDPVPVVSMVVDRIWPGEVFSIRAVAGPFPAREAKNISIVRPYGDNQWGYAGYTEEFPFPPPPPGSYLMNPKIHRVAFREVLYQLRDYIPEELIDSVQEVACDSSGLYVLHP